MTTKLKIALSVVLFGLCLAAPNLANATTCPRDAVPVGPACIDKYEASVWETTNGKLISLIRHGTVTLAQLNAGGAIQRGVGSDDYPCNDNGNDCTNIYAVSISGVTPSRFITWFQARQAAANSGKRLLTNDEWQTAAAGTPDPGGSPGSLDCNTNSAGPDLTGARTNCVSRWGVFDMVGNIFEWVAEWMPLGTACVPPLYADDANCFAGADITSFGPGALMRDARYNFGTMAGIFAVRSENKPQDSYEYAGFRAVRPDVRPVSCLFDSVQIRGTVCVDKYEASVWKIPNTGVNKKLISNVKSGDVTKAKLTSATAIANGVVQLGLATGDLAANGCADSGEGCGDIYAVSVARVTPAAFITWFQAQQAAGNSGKRLLTNAEWQLAAAGTVDPGSNDGTTNTKCNTDAAGLRATGLAGATPGGADSCISRWKVQDMVGNVWEWVADWVPLSNGGNAGWGSFSDDLMSLTGASITAGPGALMRGGAIFEGVFAGVFEIQDLTPTFSDNTVGFRAGR